MNSIVAWDHLEDAVDRLATVFDTLLDHDQDALCALPYEEAEALAEVLDAGHHTDTAARLMHRWALTEPDWDTDEHRDTIRDWLAIDTPRHPAPSPR
jgi:hypothetical protein